MIGIKNAGKSRETTSFQFTRGPGKFVSRWGWQRIIHEITDPISMEFTAPEEGAPSAG